MSKRTDRATKTINATPERLYRALSDPAELMQWLPPRGMNGRVERYDFRKGGGYRMILSLEARDKGASGKTSANEDVVEVRFAEIEPNRRIVQRVDFQSDDPAFLGTMTMIWTLTATKDGTDVGIAAENVPDGISAEDHAEGMASSLENLAAFVGGA